MICYKDTTFCASPACRNECGRHFTDDDIEGAEKWWGGPGAPVAWANFCDEQGNYKR